MKKDLVLVIGATGSVGTELVKVLKKEGYDVRGTTSQSVPKSKELVKVNLATGEGITAAMEGIDRAFFISPPGYADQYLMLSPLIQEAKRRGLKKVVLMTALGANAVETSPFRRAEIELEKSGLVYNIVRPNWFYQNFNTFWIQGIRENKKILLPAGNAKVGFIDVRDIAAVIAKLLMLDDDKINQAYDITGPESVDHNDVARLISEVTGHKIVYQEIKPEELMVGLIAGGVPKDYAAFLIMIFDFLRAGYNANVNTNVKTILGREPSGLSKYVSDYKQYWI
jgi:uncharacterized protein YbjT (DUF2867 family)